jgi:hemoglobin
VRISSRILILTTAYALACSGPKPADAPAPVAATLYQRLGGYDALAAVTDSFLQRLHGDSTIMAFFAGIDSTAMKRIRQNVVDQLCAASGGPCFYAGKPMKEVHALLEITPDVFDRFIGHFQATLTSFRVPSREQNEVMAALVSLKSEVVKKP